MTIPQFKGRIKNVRGSSSCYDRVAPGITLPNEHLEGDELKAMSSDVTVYYLHSEQKEKKVI